MAGGGGVGRRARGPLGSAAEGGAASLFFAVLGDAPRLDGRYAVFGMVTEGRGTVDALASVGLEGGKFPE